MKRQLNGQLLKNLRNCFPKWLDHSSSHQQCAFPLLHILANTWDGQPFYSRPANRYALVSHWGLNIFLMTNDAELICHPYTLFDEASIQIIGPSFLLGRLFSYHWALRALQSSGHKPFIRNYLQIFSPIPLTCLFFLLTMSFKEVFNVLKFQLTHFLPLIVILASYLRTFLPNPRM